MFKRSLDAILSTWLAGLLVFLPLALTLALLNWMFSAINRLVGPDSAVGWFFSALGYSVSNDSAVPYLLGTLVLLVLIYLLGLALQLGFRRPLMELLNLTLRRIPLIGSLYDFVDKLVGLLDKKQGTDIRAMSPVWCFFGGDGVAVLALAPNAEPIDIEGRSYYAVLVPSAPVPIGGGLLYVPVAWVHPAQIGIDKLIEVYVSMGLTPPVAGKPATAVPEAAPQQ